MLSTFSNLRRQSWDNYLIADNYYRVQEGDDDRDGIKVLGIHLPEGTVVRDVNGNPLDPSIYQEEELSKVIVDAVDPYPFITVSNDSIWSWDCGGENCLYRYMVVPADSDVGSYTFASTDDYGNIESASPPINVGSYYIYVQSKDLADNESSVARDGPIVRGPISSGICANSAEASGFNGGDGTESSPYLICTYTQLGKMGNALNKHYKLAQNIDASSSWSAGSEKDSTADAEDTDCTAFDGSNASNDDVCTGWPPVGSASNCDPSDSTADTCFQGSLDGDGFVIEKLYVNTVGSGTQYGGLFGVTGVNAKISGVGLNDIEIIASGASAYSGGVAGLSGGTIEDSYTEGPVSATTESGAVYAGGLVGSSTGTLQRSYAMGVVSATTESGNSYSGGVAGSSTGAPSDLLRYGSGFF